MKLRKSSSPSSTRSSSPAPKDIPTLFLRDKERYQEKGFGLVIAIILSILFFTLTPYLGHLVWPKVLALLNYYELTKFQGYTLVSLSFSWTVHLVNNLAMWFIYHIEHPFFERYKISSEPWPWYNDEKEWRRLMWKSIVMVTINNVVFTPFLLCLGGYILNYKIDMSFEVEDLPTPMRLVLTVIFCMLMEDFAFHHGHMLLHRPFFYKKIHKLHHEHIQTVTIASETTHPIEFLLGNIIPLVLGPILLGSKIHVWSYLIWMLVRLLDTNDGHSGYEFTWSPFRLLPFANTSEHHAFHHSINIGNYSSFFCIWDTLYGTNKEYYKYLAKGKQSQKKPADDKKRKKDS